MEKGVGGVPAVLLTPELIASLFMSVNQLQPVRLADDVYDDSIVKIVYLMGRIVITIKLNNMSPLCNICLLKLRLFGSIQQINI